jgi:hypothetical protein
MRVAYFDEAGIAAEAQEPYLVVGGVLIHGDDQWQPVEMRAHQIVQNLVPEALRTDFFFHATRLFSDHKSYKKLIPADVRFQILRELLGIVVTFDLPVCYGAVTRVKLLKSLPDWTPKQRTELGHQIAFSLCATGYQGWFNRGHTNEVAICVADRTEMQLTLKQDFAYSRRYGLPGEPLLTLFNFVEALHFAASQESIGLQLADAVAFVVKRHLMGKSDTDEFYEIIQPRLVCEPDSALWPLLED